MRTGKGAAVITLSCRIDGGDFDSAGQATRGLKERLSRLGVSPSVMRRAMIASYEAEMNVVIHARRGTLWARLDVGQLDIEVADEGPGIPDVRLALMEGWSTASSRAREMGFGAGMGLPNIRRSSDQFDIETRVGRGTRIRSTIFLGGDAPVTEPEPAVPLSIDAGQCRRCLRCLRACPTGALRVHADGPSIRAPLCIGCTACIRECRQGAIRLRADGQPLVVPKDSLLVVPAAFFAGAPGEPSVSSTERMLRGMAGLGFAEVRLAEEWAEALRAEAGRSPSRAVAPVIPPTCPAVVALVESRFPSLIPHLGPWLPPLEAAGEEFPLRSVFLVAACPAQHLSANRASLTPRLTVIGADGLREALRDAPPGEMPRGTTQPMRGSHPDGALAICGGRQVMAALAALETGAFSDVPVLDLAMCESGCSGSALLCVEPFLAELAGRRLEALRAGLPASDAGAVSRSAAYRQRPGMRLHPDMASAIAALGRIDELARALPGRDCGACGAPTCALLAEDIVIGRADRSCCPHATEVSP